MENIIVIAIVALIVGLAITYIYKEKKKGATCIGCPFANSCGSCGGSCSCQNPNADYNFPQNQ